MQTYLKEGMILKPNENNMDFYFDGTEERLLITQVGMGRVFAKDLRTGENVGNIGNYDEVAYYYDVVEDEPVQV